MRCNPSRRQGIAENSTNSRSTSSAAAGSGLFSASSVNSIHCLVRPTTLRSTSAIPAKVSPKLEGESASCRACPDYLAQAYERRQKSDRPLHPAAALLPDHPKAVKIAPPGNAKDRRQLPIAARPNQDEQRAGQFLRVLRKQFPDSVFKSSASSRTATLHARGRFQRGLAKFLMALIGTSGFPPAAP